MFHRSYKDYNVAEVRQFTFAFYVNIVIPRHALFEERLWKHVHVGNFLMWVVLFKYDLYQLVNHAFAE